MKNLVMAFIVAVGLMIGFGSIQNADAAKLGKASICHVGTEIDEVTGEEVTTVSLVTASLNSAHFRTHPADYPPVVGADGELTCELPVEEVPAA